MNWFETLTGFQELSASQVHQNIVVDGETMFSKANFKTMICGRLETPTLAELRERMPIGGRGGGKLSVREVVADVQVLHTDPSNAGAFFQVASQFNLLEMSSEYVTPEDGVSRYESDKTQGPACAIAAGAGTIYRNYFVPVNGQIGQSANNQIDCLADLGSALGNLENRLWYMQNGYAFASRDGLIEISNRLRAATQNERDKLRQQLRIGIHWDTQVTLKGCTHKVTQAYCSTLPVGYSNEPKELWADFARLVLEATYEATLCAAVLNGQSTGNRRVFLTLVGGGAFHNDKSWITESIHRALQLYANWDIEIAIVSRSGSQEHVRQLVEQFA